ncbi:MAG TPA: preprotein translocase subunit SecA, partial [Deinococcales bacterium]|nr:preprotein translocase subunit SecA [Deinococcales bacterium]
MLDLLSRLFDNNAKDVARMNRDIVQRVNALEPEMEKLDNLASAFGALRARVKAGESLDDVMPEAFAITREASKRTLGLRHFDVQVIGGAALHYGRISEMKTGEGKTLVATLALALNALEGKGAHLVTVNDYLAKVGAEQMGLIYRTLGLSVGLIQHDLDPSARKRAYGADITYVTNSELGFDYLRDNMSVSPDQLVLRADYPLNYAIIDEVDSILIDEARTPLIISGPSERGTSNYYLIAKLAPLLQRGEPAVPGDPDRTEPTGDYTIDEKARQVHLTEKGIAKAEQLLSIKGLFDSQNMEVAHMITQAIRAKELYFRDKDYIVDEGGEVVIVDEFTGRLMPGRRYGEGLHQAIEAKEGVQIQNESQTFATITYQNFFRQYTKISGMTGTAKTEEKEFIELYGADVLVIPTNLPMIRRDAEDLVYRSENGKFKAVIEEIVEKHQAGQPVLVGTISIEKSELLSKWLSDPKYYTEYLERTSGKLLEQLNKANTSGLEAFTAALAKPATLNAALVEQAKGQIPRAAQDNFAMLEREVNTLAAIKRGVKHQVLNAKLHDREADIVAQAGRSNAVTISTNMAGRGTDIKLGGNPEFAAYQMLEARKLSR